MSVVERRLKKRCSWLCVNSRLQVPGPQELASKDITKENLTTSANRSANRTLQHVQRIHTGEIQNICWLIRHKESLLVAVATGAAGAKSKY